MSHLQHSPKSTGQSPIPKILVADDTPYNVQFLVTTLTDEGYEVWGAVNGVMAIQAAHKVQPDLILLDVRMPDLDGYAVCQQLKAAPQTRQIPIIFLSALSDITDKLQAFEAGGVDYITKPFEIPEVLARIRTHLALQAAQAEIRKLNQELEQRVESRTAQLQTANALLRQEILERRQAEAALAQSEERFRVAFEQAPLPMILHAEDGEVLKINQVWTELTGYTHADIPTMTAWVAKAYGQQSDTVQAKIDRLYALKRRLDEGEFTIQTADHQTRVWQIRSAGLGRLSDGRRCALSMALDVTHRKQAELELKASEQRYRELFDSNPHPLWVYDLETLAFLAVNEAAIHQYGYTRAEFLSMTLRDIRPPEDIPKLLANVAQVHSGLDKAGVWQHCRKDGTVIAVEITSHTLDFLGRSAEVVLAHDVTAQRQAQAAICQLNAELEDRVQQRTAQLETLNQELESFSYSVSHDLRAPLRHINGFVNALRRQLSQGATLENPKVAHYLDTVERSSEKMGQLIDGLLTLSRAGRRELAVQAIQLRPLVDEAINLTRLSPAIATIDYRVGPLPTVQGDITLLQQVFNNLLSNAVKFSRDRNPAIIEVGTLEDGTIFVRDNGVGFAMQYVDQLFGAFQRLHSQQQFSGTGIGLSIVQRIIHRHDGQIWAESDPDQGATFFFTLNLN